MTAPTLPGISRKTLELDTSVQYVKGIGPKRAERLTKAGIGTVADLLEYPPFRYEDRTRFRSLRSLREGEWALTRGQIRSAGSFQTTRRKLSIFEILLRDDTGAVEVKFFNQPYLRNVYREGLHLIVYGQVRRDPFSHGALCFMNPECEIDREEPGPSVHSGRVVPIYRKLADLRTRALRQVMFAALGQLAAGTPDPLPLDLRRRLRLPTWKEAVAGIHFPDLRGRTPEEREREMAALNQGLSPFHKRFIFDELFEFQVGIGMIRENRTRQSKERRLKLGEGVRKAIKRILPFHPTEAQKRVLKEIADDMTSELPMSRLLQGDVGSGKTIVAAQAAIIAVENGYQAAVMAPTEILAEQHFIFFRQLLRPLDYRVDILKGSLPAKQKRETIERIRQGECHLAVGTHALIQDPVEFHNLALVVVDEQHRFGVIQRGTLTEKGRRPDLLVMTATPIPRSLALTLYGDLDVSVIDELPPGRKPIETRLYEETDRAVVYETIRRVVAERRQAYVVCPLVEETEKSDLHAATEMARHLGADVFPEFRVGLLHGRMSGEEKERTMAEFSSGAIQILVATTVIEVGVDVPNATLMVVEHAERFGLAQLHQLRGRVGRGTAQSGCILISEAKLAPEARKRLEVMCETNDGFRIAEVDLQLRGPGEIAGTRQSGAPVFKFANLVRDLRALELARREAGLFLRALRLTPDEESRRYASLVQRRWRTSYGVALVG